MELYFIDGKADGMLTAEVFNWTGHVLVTPRTKLKDALARSKSSSTGIYLLLGEENEESLLYVGEGEDIAKRMKNHDETVFELLLKKENIAATAILSDEEFVVQAGSNARYNSYSLSVAWSLGDRSRPVTTS
jgi:hypothetical protein|tara:strand:+ start:189 stop:584 length:396 start_codon:yes stop_codon:yes gene_type:complete